MIVNFLLSYLYDKYSSTYGILLFHFSRIIISPYRRGVYEIRTTYSIVVCMCGNSIMFYTNIYIIYMGHIIRSPLFVSLSKHLSELGSHVPCSWCIFLFGVDKNILLFLFDHSAFDEHTQGRVEKWRSEKLELEWINWRKKKCLLILVQY